MQTILRPLPASILALLFPLSATAGHWYAGGSLGQATTDVNNATVTGRLGDAGLSGTASVSDTSRLAARLFGGYAWNPYFDLEAGYTRLGDITMSLSGTGPVTVSQLEKIRPGSGDGPELAVLGRYPLTAQLSGYARAGLFHWEQHYTSSASGSGRFSGDDAVFGLGLEWRHDERWSARLSWDRYTVAHDETHFVALGLLWNFASGTTPAAAVKAEQKPRPSVPVAQVAPVDTAPEARPAPAPEPVEPAPTALERRVVQFAFKHTRLIGYASTIDATAEYLTAHPHARVHITGHTNDSGAEGFNPYLSRLRAQAVADALALRGVDRARITLEGKGAGEPVADNQTRAGRAHNRRAEIVIQDEAAAR